MIEAQGLSEFLHLEILSKYEEEVLEFYRNGKIKIVQSKKNPERSIQIIKSTVGGTEVKISQKKLRTKLHLPNSVIDIGKLSPNALDWSKIGNFGEAPTGATKKADLKNDYWRTCKPRQKFLCQGLYVGHILESMDIASEGKKYEARYWLYYLSTKGENRASSVAEEEGSSNEKHKKTWKLKQRISQFFPKTSLAFETVLVGANQENAATPQHEEQIQAAAEEEEILHSLKLQVQEILTTTCEISNQAELEIPEKSAEYLEKSTPPDAEEEAQEEPEVEAQRSFEEAAEDAQIARLEATETPVAIFEQQNAEVVRDSISQEISDYRDEEAEEESVKTLKINKEDAEEGEEAESLPLQFYHSVPSSTQVTNFHFHSSSISTIPDEMPES
ncbi:unnamed protein product [Cuscuta campestris]|uniref:Uncharacterized protein n=1 Tax=Cuscuta campestris TaxID=132261 RepID=A0A484LNQ5_9ASTE|nr:unnamed protein product [Cuscuta campestris]